MTESTISCGHVIYTDYSEYVNKRFGELTILSISEPITDKRSQRFCVCKCSCGKETNSSLSSLLYGDVTSCGHARNLNPSCNVNNTSTGIKNISFITSKRQYRVDIERNGVRYIERTYSLEEAIKIKERILQELGELD